jgi:hypothetical protein
MPLGLGHRNDYVLSTVRYFGAHINRDHCVVSGGPVWLRHEGSAGRLASTVQVSRHNSLTMPSLTSVYRCRCAVRCQQMKTLAAT